MEDKILLNRAISQAPGGVSLLALLKDHPKLSRRSAQRLISQLLEESAISAKGYGRARRFFPAAALVSSFPAPTSYNPAYEASPPQEVREPEPSNLYAAKHGRAPQADIPLSEDSRDIQAYIRLPVTHRHPIGYQTEFLEAYQPNETSYLGEPLKKHLNKLGQTPNSASPAGTFSRAILNRLMIDLSWASSHLEGNTYSHLDTRLLIEQGKRATGKAALETQMILNHKAAIELLAENVESTALNRYTLLNVHSALSENLLPDELDEGALRRHPVFISHSVYRPLGTPQAIETQLDNIFSKANAIEDAFEQSFFLMVHLPYLQPFADVNKRTSRLIANLPLFRANLCPLSFLDVPKKDYTEAILGVYEMTRVELLRDLYQWAYERSAREYLSISQELVEPDPIRLQYRDLIRQVVRHVVTHPELDSVEEIEKEVNRDAPKEVRGELRAVVIAQIRNLHEGVLVRYGLRPSDLAKWKARP